MEMQIVGTNLDKENGGKFGCVRFKRDDCSSEKYKGLNAPKANDGAIQFHSGIDLYADIGTNLHSMYDGRIQELKYVASGFGYYLYVEYDASQHKKSPHKIIVGYTHMSTYGINPRTGKKWKKGDEVLQGEILGTSGNTGNAKKIKSWRYHTHILIFEKSREFKNLVSPDLYFSTKNINIKDF